ERPVGRGRAGHRLPGSARVPPVTLPGGETMRRTWTAVLTAAATAALLVIPAPGADDPPVTKKDLDTSSNNLKQIALAVINFSDANSGRMPADITDKSGKALLSWRVAILPYIEEDKLFKEFKRDEPWDSENNKKLIAKMPKVYAPVRVKAKEGEAFYQVVSGEETLFAP